MQGSPPASVSSILSARRSDNDIGSSSRNSIPAPASPNLIPVISGGHRRNSSFERQYLPRSSTSSHGTASPGRPVKMLNGRVYGSRRASEAAEREREYMERLEPAFVEWGTSNAAAAVSSGSLGARSSGAGDGDGRRPAADDDDGGGMAWVKRRREERQRKALEEKERQQMQVGEGDKMGGGGETEGEGEGHESGSVSPRTGEGEAGGGSTSSQSSQTSQTSADMLKTTGDESKPKLRVGVEEADLQTPATNPSELPPHSPAIHISPVVSLAPRIDVHVPPASPSFSSSHDHDSVEVVNPVEISRQAEELGKTMIVSKSPMTDRKTEKQAMVIPSDKSRKAAASASAPMSPHRLGFIDPFAEVSPTTVAHARNPAEEGDEDEYEDEEGEEDGGDEDNDDSNDDDEDFDDVVRCVQHKLGFAKEIYG